VYFETQGEHGQRAQQTAAATQADAHGQPRSQQQPEEQAADAEAGHDGGGQYAVAAQGRGAEFTEPDDQQSGPAEQDKASQPAPASSGARHPGQRFQVEGASRTMTV
jgi:hypothetical protein